ncbi:hypothetical protein [Sphaerisporangium aureirubrum]|uniref:Uncharacterized protein n=1 Tax=Sphaerisporangium aureirubrum TaxID=1544736 RepID=A0ABW1NV11_9ACTN
MTTRAGVPPLGRWLAHVLIALGVLALPVLSLVPAQAASAAHAGVTGRVVLIGVPGLQWEDVDHVRTPNLWKLVGESGSASMSTRAYPRPDRAGTCPVAGWLTVSAGQRAGSAARECDLPPAPDLAPGGAATVPGWADLAAYNAATSYRATVGLLGQSVRDAGGTVAAIGPGGALAAADRSGKVGTYSADPAGLGDLSRHTLLIADIDDLARAWLQPSGFPRDTQPSDLSAQARARAAAGADQRIGALLGRVAPGTTVLVAGLSDTATTANLHVAIAHGPRPGGAGYPRGYLTASSTRQDGLVTITDVTATVLGVLGIPAPQGGVGRTWAAGGGAPAGVAETVRRLGDADLASRVLVEVRAPFFAVLVAVQILFYALAAVVVRRYGGGAARLLGWTRGLAVASGAVPVSTFLAQLVPWWTAGRPMVALIATIVGFTALIAGVALAGPWRRHVLGPLTVVAGVTSAALLLDVITGSRLQVNAVTGYEPVTGGRFYGFGNIAFAVYATGTVLALAGVAQTLGDRGRRGLGLALCLGYGLLAIFADGWPGWGADFGGVPAFVLGFAVFLMMVSGRRITAGRLAVVAAAGIALIAAIAVADWTRPADRRTHLGAFVQQVASGEALPVVGRKLGAMLGTLGNWQLTALSMAALAFLFLVLARPSRWGASALGQAYAAAPALRAGLFGVLTTALAGFLLNDSGIAIPAMALTVAVPLTLAASIAAVRLPAPPTTPGRPSAPAESTAPPDRAPR